MTKWILGVLAALLVVAPAAHAEDVSLVQPPTDMPLVAVPLIESLEPVAAAYWEARGITLPPVEVFYVEAIPGDWAVAEEPGSRIWVTQAFLHTQIREISCIVWLHERGHTAGLTHENPDPIMNADLAGAPNFHVPPKCKTWARESSRSAS